MSTDSIRAFVRAFVEELQCKGNLDIIEQCMSTDFVDHSPLPGIPPTREGVRALFTGFWAAFPDLHAEIHTQIAEGDRVVTHKTLTGTHRAPFMGIPATDRRVSIEVIDILRVAEGKITDHWAVVDQLGMLQQLGALPAPTGA
jgi:steroid delta-isomerase-like uncharacterized protein